MAELSAAQRAKVRRLSQPRELAPDEEGGELNIVPFLDIIVNILIFVLATVAVTFTATIETTPPAAKGAGVRAAVPTDPLNLTVLVVNDGIALKASGGNVAPGCEGVGAGLAIPKTGGRYDFPALTRCAAKLKRSNPSFAEETQAYVSASSGIESQIIIHVLDALRSMPDGGGVLFDDVKLQVMP